MTGNQRLIQKIKTEIQKRGEIPFADFMEMALYDPEEGYYMASHRQIGAEGDYATSSEFHPLFGKMLGKQLVQMLASLPEDRPLHLVELGAGKAVLSSLILNFMKDHDRGLFERVQYVIVEKSPALKKFQKAFLDGNRLSEKISWQEDVAVSSKGNPPVSGEKGGAKAGWTGCVFSNELVDAFPVHRVCMEKGRLREIYVTVENEKWVEVLRDPSSEKIPEYFKEIHVRLPEGMQAEVNLRALDWMQKVGTALQRGYVMTVDYGYPANQLYSPARFRGTFLCYYKHRVKENPYERIGEQDMTSHVDFSSLARAGRKAGLEVLGFTDQLSFLMGLGISQEMEALVGEQGPDDLEFQRAKALLSQERMGKVFKILIQGKNAPKVPLDGLAFRPFISGVLEE